MEVRGMEWMEGEKRTLVFRLLDLGRGSAGGAGSSGGVGDW